MKTIFAILAGLAGLIASVVGWVLFRKAAEYPISNALREPTEPQRRWTGGRS